MKATGIMASERGLPASPPRQRSLVRRVLRAVAIAVGSLLLVAAIAIAAMVRPDIPLAKLLPEYGAAPSKFIEIEGMRIHYRDEGAGQPLVLLHGFGSSLYTWDRWVRQLAGTRRLIRLDLPGFGLTGPAPDGDYSAERYVRVVAALLDSLGVERTDIAGNSMGGRTALMFALAHPERVRKLILVDAGGFAPMPPPMLFRLANTPIVGRWLVLHVTPRFVVCRNLEGGLRRSVAAYQGGRRSLPGDDAARRQPRGDAGADHGSARSEPGGSAARAKVANPHRVGRAG